MIIRRRLHVVLFASLAVVGCESRDEPPSSVAEEASIHCVWQLESGLDCQAPADEASEERTGDGGVVEVEPAPAASGQTEEVDGRWALSMRAGRRVWLDLEGEAIDSLGEGGGFAVAAVVRFAERPRGRAVVLSRWLTTDDGRGFELGMEWDGYPYFMVSGDGSRRQTGIVYADKPILRSGTVLISATFVPGRELAVYANGRLIGRNRAVVPESMHRPDFPLRLGARRGCGEHCTWDGAIGDVLFFDAPLDPSAHLDLARDMELDRRAELPFEVPPAVVFDLEPLSDDIRRWYLELDTGRGPGAYKWNPHHSEPHLYASADVAWIRWIIGDLDQLSRDDQQEWVAFLQSYQDPSDGSYPPHRLHERGHALAHVTVALNALGGRHRYPVRFIEPLLQPEAVEPWLESLDWYWQWGGSCTLWGYGMTILSTETTPSRWEEVLFAWLDREVDPTLGAWRLDHPVRHPVDHIGGGFHIWTLYASQGRPLPYPDQVIDLALSLQRPDGDFDRKFGCGVLDGVWALALASEMTSHRRAEARVALRRSLHGLMDLVARDLFETGSHGMLSRVATLALLQRALPDELRSGRPWRSPWTEPSLFSLEVEERP